MKLKEKFAVQEVGGKTVAVSLGNRAAGEFGGMITLNSTGKIIWEMLTEGTDRASVYARLVREFGVDPSVAARDADAFLDKLLAARVIEE